MVGSRPVAALWLMCCTLRFGPRSPPGHRLGTTRARERAVYDPLFGEGGCPCDALNEPFATQRGATRGAVADVLNAGRSDPHAAMLSLIRYERPLRSVLALIAWASCVRRPIRCLAWICVFSGLGLRDALLGDGRAPSVAKPPMTFGRWLKAVAGLSRR